MENQELLQAMQAMMKEEISGLRQEMGQRFEASENRMSQMMDEKLAAQDKRTDEKLAAQDKRTDEKLAAQTRQLEKKINATTMKQDNHYQKIQNLIKEGYAPIAEAAWRTEAKVKDYEEVKSTQADHARAIQQHNERITELEKNAI